MFLTCRRESRLGSQGRTMGTAANGTGADGTVLPATATTTG